MFLTKSSNSEITRKTAEDDADEIERLLNNLVSMSYFAAMEMMKRKAVKSAGRILTHCRDYLEKRVPITVKTIIKKKGIMHAVLNNQAQYSNMTANIEKSIEYLLKAI